MHALSEIAVGSQLPVQKPDRGGRYRLPSTRALVQRSPFLCGLSRRGELLRELGLGRHR